MTLLPPPFYPDTDGELIADNTVQFDWIAILKWGAEAQFRDRPDVFVAGNHLIYPEEGNNELRQAPDVYVAFGRPKGDRGSYQVWREGGVFPQVVIEVWSPGNDAAEMADKLAFYDRFGAEEYYLVYPDFPAHAAGWVRADGGLVPVADLATHVSPRLGWRFRVQTGRLTVVGPDGRPLERPDVIAVDRDAERQRAAAERARADRLAAKLRALGVDPDAV